jgi:hypothetical protein
MGPLDKGRFLILVRIPIGVPLGRTLFRVIFPLASIPTFCSTIVLEQEHSTEPSTWTHIIPLGTRTDATAHLLLYDSAGTGEFWKTDGQGGMTHLSTHTDWSATWKQIVPVRVDVPFAGGWAAVTGLLFYDDVGTLEFYTYDGQGGISLLSQYTDWRPSWKIIKVISI